MLTFVGAAAGTGPCTADYTAKVSESATAVAVTVAESSHTPPGTACNLVGYQRQAPVTLASPLGARVLVDTKTKAASSVHE